MNKNEIKQIVNSKVYENNTNDITGRGLQYAMTTIVDGLATQDEFEELASKVSNMSLDINLKGIKSNEADIKISVTSPELGDTYKAADSGDYWRYSDKITPSTPYDPYKWVNIGNILPGEALKEKDVINDLTTGGTKKVLSAEQGKIFYQEYTNHINNLTDDLHIKYVDFFDLDDIKDFGYYIVTKTVGKDIEKMILHVSNFKTTGKSDVYQVMISYDMLKTESRYFKNETWSDWVDITPVTITNFENTFENIFEGTLFEGTFNWNEVFTKTGSICIKDSDLAINRPEFLVSTNNNKIYNIWGFASINNDPTYIIHDQTDSKSYIYSKNGISYNISLTKIAEEGDVPVFKNGKWGTSQIDKLTTDLEEQIKTKADNVKLTADNKLQLVANGKEIGDPLELPSGILNLSYKDNKEYETNDAARKNVKESDRILGQIITYKLKDGTWVLDQFIGESNGSWESEGSWVSYALVRDLSPITSELESLLAKITGIESSVKDKVDGGYYEDVDDTTGEIILTSNGEESARIQIPKGGGGGNVVGVIMRAKAIGSTSLVVGENSDAIIRYNWTSIDQETGDDTGAGTVYITINGIPIYTGEVQQGDNERNLKGNLNLGANSVKVRITDGYNNVRTVSFNVQKASLVLTSTFADDVIYKTLPVAFRYTPIGSGEKKIRFWVNDVEISSETTTASGKQLTKNLSGLVGGSNSIRVIAESNISGSELISNELYYEFLYVDATITSPAITISFKKKEVTQFEIINIPYLVYDPDSLTAPVELLINGEVKQELTVTRSRQVWSYSAYEQGSFKMEVRCKGISKYIEFDVVASEYDITEEKGDLSYKATAIGKSNSGNDKANWDYGNYSALFKNFLWGEDGWQRDSNGDNHLRLIGDSAVDINITPFNSNVSQNGMTLTIEYSTANVTNPDAKVITCEIDNGIGVYLTPQKVSIKSAQSTVEANLDSSTKTSISFVIEKQSENKLISLYIDGIISGSIKYTNSDSFVQVPLQVLKLTSGNKSCTTMVYNIRWYENNLNMDQILSNYIFDVEDFDTKIDIYTRNNIMNDYGSISYDKALEFLPCLTIIGDLPKAKKDAKICTMVYEDRQNPELSFIAENVENDVQGTSSQYYPRKNFKARFKGGFTLSSTGQKVDKYSVLGTQVPSGIFDFKADFMESSGSHNTGMAILIDESLRKLNYLIPQQKVKPAIRTTVFGIPILIFHKATASSEAEFIGKYNLNDDKEESDVFGFEDVVQNWEVLNNTSDRVLFKSADFSDDSWKDDFECHQPYGNTDTTDLADLMKWVVSCIGNPTKFKNECANYWDVNFLLYYYLATEVYAMVDQRAKNMAITSYGDRNAEGKRIWRPIFFDNDTVLGITNEGKTNYYYNVETSDPYEGGHVWNGWNSALWELVRTAYKSEYTKLYQDLRKKDIWGLEESLAIFQGKIVDYWCETIYNQDAYYKYLQPVIDENNSSYLYALQGSRTKHRTWWLKNRFLYMDSKYNAGDFTKDYVTMRLYTPKEWNAVAPNPNFEVELVKPSYIQAKFGSYDTQSIRGYVGTKYKLEAVTGAQFNDTETIIFGASALKSLGDLSGKYADTVDITKAIALEYLNVGSMLAGYQNKNLTSLHTGNNELLRTVNVANCPNLKQTLELTKCYSLEEVEARGSGITGVDLPVSGILKTMNLPATTTSLIVKNQPYLTTLTLEGYSNLTTVIVDKTPQIDGYSIVKLVVESGNTKLSKVRLIDIDAKDNTAKTLIALLNITGEDDNGNSTEVATVTGKIHVSNISRTALTRLNASFPYLKITYDQLLDVIEFEDPIVKNIVVKLFDTNGDGELSTDEVIYKPFPSGALTDSGAKKFNEFHYWSGTGGVINNVDTLEELSIVSDKSSITNLPVLKTLSVYATNETVNSEPKFGYDSVTNCYSIEKFKLSGRYSETANKGAIMAKMKSSDIDYYKLVLPLRGYSNLSISEKLVMTANDVKENTYSWGRDLEQLTISNLKNVTLPMFPKLTTLIIRGFSEHSGNALTFGTTSTQIQNLIIDDSTGNNLDYFTIVGGSVKNTTIKNLTCRTTAGSYLKLAGSENGGSLLNLDLPESYVPASIQMGPRYGYTSVWGNNAKLIIRSQTLIPLTSFDNWSNNITNYLRAIYVPDHLVAEYKSTSNWSVMASCIFPLSAIE